MSALFTVRHVAADAALAAHPGAVLASLLTAHGLTGDAFAASFGLTPRRVAALLECRTRLTYEDAIVLQHAFGMRAACWIALWKAHDAGQRRAMVAA